MNTTQIFLGLLTASLLLAAPRANADDDNDVPRKTGNMTITSYRQPLMMTGGEAQSPDPMLASPGAVQHMGASSIEDYVTLDIVAPDPHTWDFTPHLANAELAQELGLGYSIYPWVHFYPEWVEEAPDFVPYQNLFTGETCRQPSGWAPFTMALTDQFYEAMAKHLGAYVEGVYVTDCVEYGEMGYPIGYTKWLRPDPNASVAWWCGDDYARADFRKQALARYNNDLDALNAAWGTDFDNPDAIAYPPADFLEANPDPRVLEPEMRRWVLDFVYWYQDAAAQRMRDFVHIAQNHFPGRRYEIKLGHGDERGISGHSHSEVCKLLSGTPGLAMRSTHASVGYFHVKRVATPARFYGFDFLTEPPGNVPPEKMPERIFTDACAGVNAYFDYTQNPVGYNDFDTYIKLLDAVRAETAVAVFFPEADHYLRINLAYPAGLFEAINPIRDVVDYDVVDERLIAEGILEQYELLLIVGNPLLEATTTDGLQARLTQDRPFTLIQVVDTPDAMASANVTRVDGSDVTLVFSGMHQYAQTAAPGSDQNHALLPALQDAYGDILERAGVPPEHIDALTARNGVWTAYFPHRILAYNPTESTQDVLGQEVAPGTIVSIQP